MKEEIKREIRKYFELNENETITYQNLWDVGTAVVRGKCITLNVFIRKEERVQISGLNFYLKIYKNESKLNPKKRSNKNQSRNQ